MSQSRIFYFFILRVQIGILCEENNELVWMLLPGFVASGVESAIFCQSCQSSELPFVVAVVCLPPVLQSLCFCVSCVWYQGLGV